MATSEKRLEEHTVKELRELASQLGIRGRSKLMHKEELICVIRRRS
ncbi:Rho termination factor N-terminal domain-containing protein [Bremerella alba]|nr:Rho termination factor N-terminal domain-containing protein [Bremerella alba]